MPGCVSVGVGKARPLAGQGSQCSVELHVYETTKARDSGVHTARTIVSELWRKEKGGKVLVREAREASWTAAELPPGKYTLRVRQWVDAEGGVHGLGSADSASFTVGAGERARSEVVLKHPKRVVTAVAVAVILVGVGVWVASLSPRRGSHWGACTRAVPQPWRGTIEKTKRRDTP